MSLTPAQLRSLERKASTGELEVEDLTRVAAIGDVRDSDHLRGMKARHGWSDSGRIKGRRVVPFGRWADVVCRFLEEGHAGLVRMATEAVDAHEFCIAVLVDVRRPESVDALLQIAAAPRVDAQHGHRVNLRVADGLNLLLSFKNAVPIGDADASRVRAFLHALLAEARNADERATVVCALRGVGNSESMALIAALTPFRSDWEGLEKSAVRPIRKRLGSGTGELS